MPLLLTREDLWPLVRDPSAMAGAFAAVEQAYREAQRAETRHVESLGLPLTGPQRSLRICPGFAGCGVSIRTYPTHARDARPDSSVNLLFDRESGQLLALMAGEDLNMFRTAAPGGVAARRLAPAGARTLAVLGSGRQARAFLPAMRYALPSLERVRVYSPTREHREAYAAEMTQSVDLVVDAVGHPREAVMGADVVVVASSGREPVLDADWVQPGACVISIADGQLPAELVVRARVTVSARSEVVGEGAEREPYATLIASGGWPGADAVVEIGQVILGEVPGRVREDQVVIHEMPGLSFWDAAILGWAYDWAVRQGAGTRFTLSSA